MAWNGRKKLLSLLCLSGLSIIALPSWAADSTDLESALAGFEAEDSSKVDSNTGSVPELDQALDGFGTETSGDSSDDLGAETGFEITRPGGFDAFASLEKPVEKPASWRLNGDVGVAAAYAYQDSAPKIGEADWQGLNQAKVYARLALEKDWQDWQGKISALGAYDAAYQLKGRSDYASDLLAQHESELELGETYLSGSLSANWDLKVGRQIEVWGTSDSIRVTDVINPLDNRTPGLTDIEDLRLPITLSKLSYYWQDWAFSMLALHEQRAPKQAAIDSDFLPTADLGLPPNTNLAKVSRGSEWQTTGAFSAEGRFSGWDLSLYAAEVLDSRWHFNSTRNERVYSTVKMTGLAANWALNGWLLKAEGAYLTGLRYNTTNQRKNRFDVLLGLDYLSLPHWSFSLEIADRWIQDYESQMANFPDAVDAHNWQTAFRASRDFNHELGKVSYLLSALGEDGQQGGFQRFWVEYDWTDQQKMTLGAIDYFGQEHPYWQAITHNDRLFVDWVWKF